MQSISINNPSCGLASLPMHPKLHRDDFVQPAASKLFEGDSSLTMPAQLGFVDVGYLTDGEKTAGGLCAMPARTPIA